MTAQVGEILIFDGEEMSMAFCPPLPDRHSSIIELEDKDIENDDDSFIRSTACWRGYIGTWEVKNGQFYLIGITGRYKMTDKNPILADWFSGVIQAPKGELLHSVYMDFDSIYEQEIHLKIEKGKVVKSEVIDNRNQEFDTTESGCEILPDFENSFDDEI